MVDLSKMTIPELLEYEKLKYAEYYELLRKDYLAYVEWMNYPDFKIGKHIDFICKAVQQLVEGKRYLPDGRLVRIMVVTLPPQHGKTQSITRALPSWYLGKWPERKVLLISYNSDFATDFGRSNRENMEKYGKDIFGVTLKAKPRTNTDFYTVRNGSVRARGYMSGISGLPANCFPAGTLVSTEIGQIPIEKIFLMENPPRVLSYNHADRVVEYKNITASRKSASDNIVKVGAKGAQVYATADHRFYTLKDGYKPAYSLNIDDSLFLVNGTYVPVNYCVAVSGTNVDVYDIQVEGNHNFFANGVLVHNCIIIDDPIKNRLEADSESDRERKWNEYLNAIRTRLTAEGVIILILTRWHCLIQDSPIICPDGIRLIQDIKEGDLVYTSAGEQKVVAALAQTTEDKIVNINTFYTPQVLSCTTEHEILTDKGWKQAKDISIKDYLATPIININTSEQEMLSYFPGPMERSYKNKTSITGKKQKVSKEVLKDLVDKGHTYLDCAKILGFKSKQAVYEYACLYGINTRNDLCVNKDILLDKDIWMVIGFWLAEGSLTYGRKNISVVRFTLGYYEQVFAQLITAIMKKHGVSVNTSTKGKSAIDVRFSCYQFAEFLKLFGVGSHNKVLPDWVLGLPDNFFYALLEGFWRGDGCFSGDIGYRFISVSYPLLRSIQQGLLKRGIISSIVYLRKTKNKTVINGKSVNSGVAYELRVRNKLPFGENTFHNPPVRRGYIKDGYLYSRVRKTTITDYSGFVYDIKTEAGDFLTPNGIVHNCDDLAGRIIERESLPVEVIRIPCEAEENDILGRAKGDPLFPEIGKDKKWLEEFKVTYLNDPSDGGLRAWNALFQGRPSSLEGNMFQRFWWNYWIPKDWDPKENTVRVQLPDGTYTVITPVRRPEQFDRWLQSWDLTFKSGDGTDNVAGGVLANLGSSIFLLDAEYAPMSFIQTLTAISAMTKGWPQATLKLIENKANGEAVYSMLQNKLHGIVMVEPQGSKTERAAAVSPLVEAGNVFIPHPKVYNWVNKFIDQMAEFPHGSNDDYVDMMSQALLRFMYASDAIKKPQKSELQKHKERKMQALYNAHRGRGRR